MASFRYIYALLSLVSALVPFNRHTFNLSASDVSSDGAVLRWDKISSSYNTEYVDYLFTGTEISNDIRNSIPANDINTSDSKELKKENKRLDKERDREIKNLKKTFEQPIFFIYIVPSDTSSSSDLVKVKIDPTASSVKIDQQLLSHTEYIVTLAAHDKDNHPFHDEKYKYLEFLDVKSPANGKVIDTLTIYTLPSTPLLRSSTTFYSISLDLSHNNPDDVSYLVDVEGSKPSLAFQCLVGGPVSGYPGIEGCKENNTDRSNVSISFDSEYIVPDEEYDISVTSVSDSKESQAARTKVKTKTIPPTGMIDIKHSNSNGKIGIEYSFDQNPAASMIDRTEIFYSVLGEKELVLLSSQDISEGDRWNAIDSRQLYKSLEEAHVYRVPSTRVQQSRRTDT